MSDDTPISWARHTWNMWWGCDEPGAEPGTDFTEGTDRAPECLNCYARAWDHRLGGNHWGPGPRKFASESYLAKALKWNAAAERAGVRASVFCQSMGDWAELHPDPEINARMDVYRGKMWELIWATPWLDWLLLTKRVDRLAELLPWTRPGGEHYMRQDGTGRTYAEPWPNAWLGTSCGARSSLWRVDRLRRVPAAVRFISAEPLTEHITAEDWDRVLRRDRAVVWDDGDLGGMPLPPNPVHWLIVGDESHQDPKKRRPAQVDWIRTAREAALRHGVAFHFKQWNGPSSPAVHGMRAEDGKGKQGKIHLPLLDGKVWDQRPAVDPSS